MKAPSYISLTQALTEIAEGLSQNADDYITARNAKEQERIAMFLESARERARALVKAGFDPDVFQMSEPNALLTGYLPEVAAHRALSSAHILERDEETKRLWMAGREIVAAGACGDLLLRGRPKGDGKLEIIDAAELRYLAFNELTGFDTLYNRDTEYFWTQVTLEKAEFASWALRAERLATDPSAASEKRAIPYLAKCLEANEWLTREEGITALQKAEIPVTKAGFKRIWPTARVQAGLEALGQPGPRPKRSKS